jgi:TonB family protein
VDLAPILHRLADSVRASRAATRPDSSALAAPTTADAVDQTPVLVSHPPIHYPVEMQALGVSATVLVEARLNAGGHVEPASVRVVTSPNHAFDAEARRVVAGSVYRPACRGGRAVRSLIRQAVTFVSY